jgi:2-dehydro-3-deoxyphosphogluconate aldolase/(4S)-4-hydroxy-2-oxoglutarate aldolase
MANNMLPYKRIIETGVMAAARIPDANDAMDVANALLEGGVSVIAYSMAMPNALQAIESVAGNKTFDISVGVGTALDAESTRMAILSGAEFVVSPTINIEVIRMAHRYAVPVFAGALTPNEILFAFELGCQIVKVFPGGNLGPSYIKSIAGPLNQIPLMPDGGVNLDNAAALIKAGGVALGVGGSLVEKNAIRKKEFRQITRLAQQFIATIQTARGDTG